MKTPKEAPLWQQKIALGLIKLVAWTPQWLKTTLIAFVARLLIILPLANNKKRIALINYRIAFAGQSDAYYRRLLAENIRHLLTLMMEVCQIWVRGATPLFKNVTIDDQAQLNTFEQDNASSGILLITPHLGNWELFGLWFAKRYGIHAMFKPSSMPALDRLITQGRQQFGGETLTADQKGVVQLFKLLKKKEIVLRLPDHMPKEGGTHVPFLGHIAYTETLNAKLLQKLPDTQVYVGAMIRQKAGFTLLLNKIELYHNEPRQSLTAGQITTKINQAMADLIEEHPEQYHWFYERFRRLPKGMTHPYRKKKAR